MKITAFHGSDHIIKEPIYQGGKEDNDYGNGFYLTEYEERAKSWAALNGNQANSIVNVYEIELAELKILDLNDYGVLSWIAEVISHRGTSQEMTSILANRLIDKYHVCSNDMDMIKGYRADDSYTQVIEAFLLNQIQIQEVQKLFYKGSLGNQLFLKSEKAFSKIKWVDAYQVQKQQEYEQSDLKARQEVNRFLNSRRQAILVDGYQVSGITAQEAVKHHYRYHKDGEFYEQTSI